MTSTHSGPLSGADLHSKRTFFKNPSRWPYSLTPNALPSTTLSPTLTLLDGIDLQGFQPQLCPEFTENNRYKCYELSKKWGHQMHFCTNGRKQEGTRQSEGSQTSGLTQQWEEHWPPDQAEGLACLLARARPPSPGPQSPVQELRWLARLIYMTLQTSIRMCTTRKPPQLPQEKTQT